MVYRYIYLLYFFPQRSHRFLSKVHCTCKHNSVRPASLATTSCEITLQRSVAFTAKPNKNISISTRTTQLMLGIPFLYSLIVLIIYFPTDRTCRAPLHVLVARGPFHRRSRPVWTIILHPSVVDSAWQKTWMRYVWLHHFQAASCYTTDTTTSCSSRACSIPRT